MGACAGKLHCETSLPVISVALADNGERESETYYFKKAKMKREILCWLVVEAWPKRAYVGQSTGHKRGQCWGHLKM